MRMRVLPGWMVFVFSFGQLLIPVSVLAESKGVVDFSLQWGSSSQTYTYVFSGVVTCSGRPCANAQVQVDLESAGRGSSTATTHAGADGRYLLQVTLGGAPEDSATWKLAAKISTLAQGDPVELEGRVILMQNQTTVVVERPIQIVHS